MVSVSMAQGHEDSVFAGTKCVDPDSRPSPDPLSIQRVDEHDVDLAPFEGEQGLLVVEAPQDEPIYLRGAAPVRRVGDELGVAFWHRGTSRNGPVPMGEVRANSVASTSSSSAISPRTC